LIQNNCQLGCCRILFQNPQVQFIQQGAAMTGDIYLHIEGMTGLARPASRHEWIRCDGMTWSRPEAADPAPSGKSGAGRRAHGSIVLARMSDWASPALLRICQAGNTMPQARIDLTRPGVDGGPATYVEIDLFDIVAVQLTADERQQESSIEQLQLAYSNVKWRYSRTPG
jgi:type VI secretion system Hcp family effector